MNPVHSISRKGGMERLEDVGNKDVWDAFAVSVPVLAILLCATLHVASDTVSKHTDEEAEVKVRQEGAEASDQTPRGSHDQISSVVGLTHNTPPTIGQQQVTVLSLDVAWVLDVAIWQLRESVADNEGTILLHTESVLLRVTSVKDVVSKQQGKVQEGSPGQRVSDGHTSSLFILHQVNGGIAVSEGDTSHVPEDQHET